MPSDAAPGDVWGDQTTDPRYTLLRSWSNRAWLMPVAASAVAWFMAATLQHQVTCSDRACTRGALFLLRKQLLEGVRGKPGAAQAAADLAARYAWEPVLVLFVAVAAGCVAFGWRTMDQAVEDYTRDHGEPEPPPLMLLGRAVPVMERDRGYRNRLVALAVVGVSMALLVVRAAYPHRYLLRVEVLEPMLRLAFPKNDYPLYLVELSESVFVLLVFLAGTFVIVAAGTALLLPRLSNAALRARPWLLREHLALQWRRLNWTLYAGALLLVSAVLQQATLYGWAPDLARAAVEQQREAKAERTAGLERAQASLDFVARRVAADSVALARAEARGRPALAASLRAWRDSAAAQALAVDRLAQKVRLDTLEANRRIHAQTVLIGRMESVSTAAMARSVGLVYTVLLAVMYVPAALLLMERARELSGVECRTPGVDDADEAARAEWRKKHGLAFSLPNQWGKVLAVLAPWLASGPAAFLSAYLR